MCICLSLFDLHNGYDNINYTSLLVRLRNPKPSSPYEQVWLCFWLVFGYLCTVQPTKWKGKIYFILFLSHTLYTHQIHINLYILFYLIMLAKAIFLPSQSVLDLIVEELQLDKIFIYSIWYFFELSDIKLHTDICLEPSLVFWQMD